MLSGISRQSLGRQLLKSLRAALRIVLFCCVQSIAAVPLRAQMLPLPAVPAPLPANSANAFQIFVADEETYDNDLFRVPNGFDLSAVLGAGAARADHLNSVSAGVLGQWTIGQQLLLYSGEVDVGRFARNTFLDNTSGNAKLTWDWRLGSLLTGDVGFDAQRLLAGFTNNRSFVKDLVDNKQYFGNGNWQVGPHLSLFAGVQDQQLTNSSVVRQGDDFRLTSEDAGLLVALSATDSVGWEYQHASGRFPFGIELLNNVSTDLNFDDNSARFLLKYAVGGATTINASAGYLKRDYSNNSSANFSGDVWRAALQWQPLAKSQVTFTGWRDLYAYLQAQSDYFVATGRSISPSWNPTEKLRLSLLFSWENQNYIESASTLAFSSREDRVTTTQMALTYYPGRRVTINLAYRSETRVSNLAAFSYDDKIASAKVTVKFGAPAGDH
jgi:hypothetical protein